METNAVPIWPCEEEFAELVKCHDGSWVMDTETDGLEVRGPGSKHEAKFVGLQPLGCEYCCIFTRRGFEQVRSIVEGLHLIGHNLRFDLHALDLVLSHPFCDTMATAYYRNTTGKRSLDHLARVYGWDKIKTPDLIKQGRIDECDTEDVAEYLADDCGVTGKLHLVQKKSPAGDLWLDYETERVVYNMERRGVRLLEDKLARLGAKIHGLINDKMVKLRAEELLGDPNSPKQVAEWLAWRGRVLPRTPKGNPSTAKLVLQGMADKGDELAELLLAYRRLAKMEQAFVTPLPLLARDGMLYPEVKTTRTKTGRFSYATPNLQQVPKRGGDLGKAFRACFTSDKGGVSGADYSQVELRVAAALANEPVLLEAFNTGGDPHTEVAAKMLGKRPEDITPDERFRAKAVNFGILNGMGANRLSIELKSSKFEASKFLGEYRRSLPQLTEWMEGIWTLAETEMVVETLAGRLRPFGPEESIRSAISVIVQGTAAELMRRALIEVDNAGLEPILVVHDEIVCAGRGRGPELAELMTWAADEAFPELNSLTFNADYGEGDTWADV